ncbi:uncharacterized protein MELLADRAFT_113231 [Melampsora larici-populina 98AG31]|uniref:Secreted protein n=1 Tax=Melampsora larici-populina (strain 98AG31 / pathotype 3-4-7) TaxID=747676 RepID=F4S970_MELLP|nr:uncharacterized protein MELLADRAFT_113231 [Melampsora larici-populina 98AG31]EGF98766.1 hypothetical protein MELLADRAFT_113231 [Melampsora larici-populina 98AG31]
MLSFLLAKLFSIIIFQTWNLHGCSGLQLKYSLSGAQDYHQDLDSAFGTESFKSSSSGGQFPQDLCDLTQYHNIGHTQHPNVAQGEIYDPNNPHQFPSGLYGMYTPEQGHFQWPDNQQTVGSDFSSIHSLDPQRNSDHLESMNYINNNPGHGLYTPHDDFLWGLDNIPIHPQLHGASYVRATDLGELYEPPELSQESAFLSREIMPSHSSGKVVPLQSKNQNQKGYIGLVNEEYPTTLEENVETDNTEFFHGMAIHHTSQLEKGLYQNTRHNSMEEAKSNTQHATEDFTNTQNDMIPGGPRFNFMSAHKENNVYDQPHWEHLQHEHVSMTKSLKNAVSFENEQQSHHIIDPIEIIPNLDKHTKTITSYSRADNTNDNHFKEQEINCISQSQQLSTTDTTDNCVQSFTHDSTNLLENSWLKEICPYLYSDSYPMGRPWPEYHISNTEEKEPTVGLKSDRGPENKFIHTGRENPFGDNTHTILTDNITHDGSESNCQETPVVIGPQVTAPNRNFPEDRDIPSLNINHPMESKSNMEIHQKDDSNQKKRKKGLWVKTSAESSRKSNKRFNTNLDVDRHKIINQTQQDKISSESLDNDYSPRSSHLFEDNPPGAYIKSEIPKYLELKDLDQSHLGKRKLTISKNIGIMNVNRSPTLCYEIVDWFHEIYMRIRVQCKDDSEIKSLGCAVKNAYLGIVMPFFGILKAFEYDESGTHDIQMLLNDGWKYIKNIFSHWKSATPEHFEFGKITKFGKASDILISGWQLKYLKGISGPVSIPFSLVMSIVHMWSKDQWNSRIPEDINLGRLMEVNESDTSSREGGLYSRSGIRNDAFWGAEQFSKDHWYLIGSAELPLPNRTGNIYNSAQFHTNIGRGMCKNVHSYFEKLIRDLIGRYKELNNDSFYTTPKGVHISNTMHSPNLDLIVQAVSIAQYKVTVPYMGALRHFYKRLLSEEQLEILLMNAWIFLKEIYSKWILLDFQPNNLEQLFQSKGIGNFQIHRSTDPAYMFKIHFKLNKSRTPKSLVIHLLNSWSKMITKSQKGLRESQRFSAIGFLFTPFNEEDISHLW